MKNGGCALMIEEDPDVRVEPESCRRSHRQDITHVWTGDNVPDDCPKARAVDFAKLIYLQVRSPSFDRVWRDDDEVHATFEGLAGNSTRQTIFYIYYQVTLPL
jgi:hypothetical protein